LAPFREEFFLTCKPPVYLCWKNRLWITVSLVETSFNVHYIFDVGKTGSDLIHDYTEAPCLILALWRLTTPYRGHTAPLTSKRFILYIYSTNIGTGYFKHGIYSPFSPLQDAVCFIILTYFGSCIIHILFIYSTNIGNKYFKHGVYSPFFSSSKCSLFHNSNVFWFLYYSHFIYLFNKYR